MTNCTCLCSIFGSTVLQYHRYATLDEFRFCLAWSRIWHYVYLLYAIAYIFYTKPIFRYMIGRQGKSGIGCSPHQRTSPYVLTMFRGYRIPALSIFRCRLVLNKKDVEPVDRVSRPVRTLITISLYDILRLIIARCQQVNYNLAPSPRF